MKIKKFATSAVSVTVLLEASASVWAVPTLTDLATVPYPTIQSLVVDSASNVYGSADGTVFELSGPNHQTMTTLANGMIGPSQLIADSAGNLYGTTPNGSSTQSVGNCVRTIWHKPSDADNAGQFRLHHLLR